VLMQRSVPPPLHAWAQALLHVRLQDSATSSRPNFFASHTEEGWGSQFAKSSPALAIEAEYTRGTDKESR
jgi:hypothetical protein